MNIGQIVPEMDIGGVEQGTLDLARGLAKRGHKSIVISNGGRLIPELESIGVKYYTLPVHRKSPIVMAKLIKEVRKILHKENIDILHAKSRVPAWIGYYSCRNLKKTHFITGFHGFYSPHFFSKIMAKGERVIAVSSAIAEYAKEKFKVPAEKLRVVYNGVELKEYPQVTPPPISGGFTPLEGEDRGEGENRIGILARVTPLKGHSYFIEALAKVKEKFPKVRGFIIGPLQKNKISYQQQLEKLLKKLHLRNLKFIPPEQKEKIFPTLNILVSSSIVPEAFGRTMVEAQLAEILVIGTNIGASPEIIEDRKTGLLVPPGDSYALCEAIIWSFTHQKECKKMAESAKKIAQEKFSIEQMIEKTITVYQEVLSLPPIPSHQLARGYV